MVLYTHICIHERLSMYIYICLIFVHVCVCIHVCEEVCEYKNVGAYVCVREFAYI